MSTYKKLFSIPIYHEYFLAKVSTNIPPFTVNAFKEMTIEQQPDRLEEVKYNINDFCTIQPTRQTTQHTKDFKLVPRYTNIGIDLFAKVNPNDTLYHQLGDPILLEWLVYINDDLFTNYTALDLEEGFSQKVFHFGSQQFGSYAETSMQVIFSNSLISWLNTFSETITDIEITNWKGEKVELAGFSLPIIDPEQQQQFSGFSGRLSIKIGTTDPFELYVNPELSMNRPFAIIGVIPDSNMVNTTANFEVFFDNRSTEWKYYDNDNTEITGINSGPYPLLKHGYIPVTSGNKDLPNPDAARLEESSSGGTYISRVYI